MRVSADQTFPKAAHRVWLKKAAGTNATLSMTRGIIT